LYVGDIGGNFANAMDGWIDELRVVKGTAVWTSGFTPPTEAYTPSTAVGLTAAEGTGYTLSDIGFQITRYDLPQSYYQAVNQLTHDPCQL
jgi:hypothetical protein